MTVSEATVRSALGRVKDPEIGRPLTELDMVKSITVGDGGHVAVEIWLTVSGCPMRDRITSDVTRAIEALPEVTAVTVQLDVMDDERRKALHATLRGGQDVREIPFAQPSSLTRVYAIASGKGGVGKSTVTANLAVAMAQQGLTVGVLDADVYGHSLPRMLGITAQPTRVDQMIMPPSGHGVRLISIGMFVKDNAPVVWRGPMLDRMLHQFLADVWWGDLDVLLLDLPPGTGDIAISLAQKLPSSEIVVVTTPQKAAMEVAERAGTIALQTHQKVIGVVENMSGLPMPDGSTLDLFGSGGGAEVAATLTRRLGHEVSLLGQVPIDVATREGGDSGVPIVLSHPDSPAAKAFLQVADALGARKRGLAGRSLGLTPARKPA